MVRDKVRIRFRKDGALRLVSHHDLMRCFERMLRRAGLPFHSTEGFNPKPRLIFALSLALGIVGAEEVVELELDDELPIEELHERLSRQAPDGLTIRSVCRVAPKAGAHVRRVCYRMALAPNHHEHLLERIHTLMSTEHCWVDRTRPQRRRVDLRPFVRGIHVYPDALEIDLWVTPHGTARPDEVLVLLGLGDRLDRGAVLERTLVELHDECGAPEAGPATELLSVAVAAGSNASRHLAEAGEVPPLNTQPEGNA
jgi:radical SAM-linked protein